MSDALRRIREQFFSSAGALYLAQQHCQDCENGPSTMISEPVATIKFEVEERNTLPILLFPDLKAELKRGTRDSAQFI